MIRLKLSAWIDAFLRDCKTRELSPHSIEYYKKQLANFATFCNVSHGRQIEDLTPDTVRAWLLHLEATGHNPGGRHAKFRALRTFLNWYEREAEPDNWTNPIHKVKPPKVQQPPIEGVSLADVRAMLDTCADNFIGLRDRAILLCLLDTGARVGEFLAVDIQDVDVIGGDILLRRTKNKKPRHVFIGKKSRKALRRYLLTRVNFSPALWVTKQGERLAVSSLQGMLRKRARLAGLQASPSPHDFRRAFCLQMLRAGVDVITLSRLVGHTDLSTLRRYLAQTSDDLQAAHDKGAPVDKLF